MLKIYQEPVIQKIEDQFVKSNGVELFLKREDLIHPYVSGNKWRKLKYNLMEARKSGFHTLLTFGGAYSNHIYTMAAATKEAGFKSIGVIRGEEHNPLNPTLRFATDNGMHLHYMDRTTYRLKNTFEVIDKLREVFGDFYLIPEGGTNELAIKGCEEIVDNEVRGFDYICSSVGTGGTLAGVISGLQGEKSIIGFSSLKGDFLKQEVSNLLTKINKTCDNWEINIDYHFGGYAKIKSELIDFINEFKLKNNIQLDPIYTGKMMFGLYDLIEKGFFKTGTRVLAIHTGGLQGLKGFKSIGLI